jgi:hypothetical protein
MTQVTQRMKIEYQTYIVKQNLNTNDKYNGKIKFN